MRRAVSRGMSVMSAMLSALRPRCSSGSLFRAPSRLLTPLCKGVTLVGFHRMLQGGLLPRAAADSAMSFQCVWRRLQEAAKTHRLCSRRDRPMTLNEGLALAGLPPLTSDDAAMRALAVRDLWIWLDSLG